jgi:hypothetical protein
VTREKKPLRDTRPVHPPTALPHVPVNMDRMGNLVLSLGILRTMLLTILNGDSSVGPLESVDETETRNVNTSSQEDLLSGPDSPIQAVELRRLATGSTSVQSHQQHLIHRET